MRKPVLLMSIIGGLMVAIVFNNCASEHSGQGNEFLLKSEVAFLPCAFTDEMDLYAQTFHPFVTQNCASCHVEGGEGKGAFASAGLQVAYNAFSVVGYDLVSSNATNSGHKPPYTGPQHNTLVSLLRTQWEKGLENIAICKSGGGAVDPSPVDETNRLETRSQGINAPENGSFVKLTWNLSTEIIERGGITLPTVPGSTLSVDVRRLLLGPKPVYEISSPTLHAGSTDVKIFSLLIKINGKLVPNQTTFRFVDESIYSGDDLRLAPGSMVVDGAIAPTDVISLSIGTLAAVVLPPPPPKPMVQFAQTTYSTLERVNPSVTTSSQNYVSISLVLSTSSEKYVTATVGIVSSQTTATPRRSETISFDGNDLVVDRWNWDYAFDTLAVVFAPGETQKNLNLKLSHDQRFESDERIQLVISSAVNADRSPTQATLTILDDDAPNNTGAPTFTSLMTGGQDIRQVSNGILRRNCLECHNSVDNRGGYNLSDYDLMIENGVLIPGDVNSKMFQRMNAIVPGLRPMPLGGLLSTPDRQRVQNWILNGAKND